MFFIFSKIFAFLVSPLTWIVVLLFMALLCKKAHRKKVLLIIAIVLLLLFSNEFLFKEIIRIWEFKPVELKQTEKYDYAIVLGGFSRYDTSLSRLQLNVSGDRIWQALRLYKEKKINKIFISGGSGQILHQKETEADKVKNCLLDLQIPDNEIFIETLSRNTHENAKFSMDWIMKHEPNPKILLITSACHMKRAYACFKKYAPSIVPYPVNFLSSDRKYDLDNLILPDSQTLHNWDILFKEVIGYLMYKIVGYV